MPLRVIDEVVDTFDGRTYPPGSFFPEGPGHEPDRPGCLCPTSEDDLRDTLDQHPVELLRELASEEGVDLAGLTSKAEILTAIRAARGETAL